MFFCLDHTLFVEKKDICRRNGGSPSLLQPLDKVFKFPHAAERYDRNRRRICHTTYEIDVVPLSRAIPINGLEENFTGATPLRLFAPLYGIQPRLFLPKVLIDLICSRRRVFLHIDAYDNAL